MSKTKKILALALSACMSLSLPLLAGCGGGDKGGTGSNPGSAGNPSNAGNSGTGTGTGSVYYLNFKPEQDPQWQALAKLYTEQTGVPVTVVTAASGVEVKVQTAASGQYETTLMS